MIFSSDPLTFIITMLMVIIALSIHEFAHAFAADKLGDPTPRLQGRLTLNPLAHLDPLGTALIAFTGFGWGKPVQFDPYNLKNPVRDGALIAVAGPISNILQAIVASIFLHLAGNTSLAGLLLTQFIFLNISLAIFNLIPVAPLDGFKIVAGLLPKDQVRSWHELEQYGIFFLIVLLVPILSAKAPITLIIQPIIQAIAAVLT